MTLVSLVYATAGYFTQAIHGTPTVEVNEILVIAFGVAAMLGVVTLVVLTLVGGRWKGGSRRRSVWVASLP